MIRKNLKILIITSIIILLPILIGLALWSQLPDKIPTHWNATGEIDGWSSKGFAVFGIPLMMLGFQLICFFATLCDPKQKNHSQKILHLAFWLVPVISTVLSAITYAAAMGTHLKIEVILPVILGLLLTAIGNYLPKCKQNYTVGIKLPWTLNNEENWNKTHRLAGWIWMIGGLVIMLMGFFGLLSITVFVALAMALVPMIYSFILHKKGV
ncbi:MAG: DUF1648 domain-containing protein [Ruminococcaceae bacterium]|nr:DUF1648 domain-containing protein [Oscillospiraceae bacterium]